MNIEHRTSNIEHPINCAVARCRIARVAWDIGCWVLGVRCWMFNSVSIPTPRLLRPRPAYSLTKTPSHEIRPPLPRLRHACLRAGHAFHADQVRNERCGRERGSGRDGERHGKAEAASAGGQEVHQGLARLDVLPV